MPHLPLPPERRSVTHRFNIGNGALKGYIIAGLYEDGSVGEIFFNVNKAGSLERGLLSCLGLLASMLLQNGVPLGKIVEKLEGMRFEPAGMTENPEIPMVKSIADYAARWLGRRFLSPPAIARTPIRRPVPLPTHPQPACAEGEEQAAESG